MSTTSTSNRRQKSERRTNSDRRKQSEGRFAVFEVCRSMLHLALIARNNYTDELTERVVTRSLRWR
jgi:hypothetical protein